MKTSCEKQYEVSPQRAEERPKFTRLCCEADRCCTVRKWQEQLQKINKTKHKVALLSGSSHTQTHRVSALSSILPSVPRVSWLWQDLKQLTSSSNLKLRRVGKLRTGLQLGQQFVCICTREAEHVAKHVYEPELQLWWSVKRSWVQFFLTLWFQVEICFKFIPYAKQRKGWTSQLKGCWFLNLENFKKK